MQSKVYHIYAKQECLYNCLKKNNLIRYGKPSMVWLVSMKTDYHLEDLSYEELNRIQYEEKQVIDNVYILR